MSKRLRHFSWATLPHPPQECGGALSAYRLVSTKAPIICCSVFCSKYVIAVKCNAGPSSFALNKVELLSSAIRTSDLPPPQCLRQRFGYRTEKQGREQTQRHQQHRRHQHREPMRPVELDRSGYRRLTDKRLLQHHQIVI